MRQCVVKNVAGSGVRWVDVSAERFPGWIASFAVRHGVPAAGAAAGELEKNNGADEPSAAEPLADEPLAAEVGEREVTFTAPDGAVAECHPPFPESLSWPARAPAASPAQLAAAVAAHAAAPRTVGVLLVRLGGYAAGVFTGYPPALADAKTGSRLVHGRSAAGGWSQQRFARRREKQADEALRAAADAALLVFGRGPRLDAVVLGGDKRAVAELRDDRRLAAYLARATERFITVPDPKRAVLAAVPAQFTAVRIRLSGPAGATPHTPGPA
jgi:Actinobacteria/chloroflexi VLRF1 release factor